MKLLRLSITINFTKMKEDNISQLGDYDLSFWEQEHTHGSCYISLFKFNSFDQFITPQIASNFRHLLSCGTIVTFGTHRASREGQTSRVACLAFIPILKTVLNVFA